MDTFGDVTAEYLALRRRAGVVQGVHDAVVVSGPDAKSFLQGLISQDVERAEQGSRSFLLTPQGKMQALLWLAGGDGDFLLVADAGLGATVADQLMRYRIRVDVSVSLEERSIVEVWGPAAEQLLASGGWKLGQALTRFGDIWLARIPLGPLPRFLTAGIAVSHLTNLGAERVGTLASEAVRIEAGEPRMGMEVNESTIPQETGLVEVAVSFTKGCYLGQELVARIDSRGRVNRILAGLVLDDAVLPPVGSSLRLGDTEVGVLGSIAESLTLRAPIGLAMIRRQAEEGSKIRIRWDGGQASGTVMGLPLDDFTDS